MPASCVSTDTGDDVALSVPSLTMSMNSHTISSNKPLPVPGLVVAPARSLASRTRHAESAKTIENAGLVLYYGPMAHGHQRQRATTHSRRSVEVQLKKAEAICLRQCSQLTELRRLVLRLVLEADGPLTAYKLLDRLREIRKSAVPPTIYRALDFLMEQGLVHKIERLNAYIPCTDGEHRHHAVQFLICKNCGTVAEIEDQAVSRALDRAAEKQGFRPDSAVVELAGVCASCLATAA